MAIPHCRPVTPVEKKVCEQDQARAQMARLLVLGLACPNCAARARNALLGMDGVLSADVDWRSGLTLVDFVPAITKPELLIRGLSEVTGEIEKGFHAVLIP